MRKVSHYRKRKRQIQAEKQGASSEEHHPYFGHNGELEAEERMKHELQAKERRYELDENGIKELPTKEKDDRFSNSRMQELRGEEHCGELG